MEVQLFRVKYITKNCCLIVLKRCSLKQIDSISLHNIGQICHMQCFVVRWWVRERERPSQTKEQIFGNHKIPRSKIIDGGHELCISNPIHHHLFAVTSYLYLLCTSHMLVL